MAGHTDLVILAAAFTQRHPGAGDPVACWLSWCLPRSIDPIAPPAQAITTSSSTVRSSPKTLRSTPPCSATGGDGAAQPGHPTPPPARPYPPPPAPASHNGAGRGTGRRRHQPATLLSDDQTTRLLRAANRQPGESVTVVLFLLATDSRMLVHHICWLDVTDVLTIHDTPLTLALRLPDGSTITLPSVTAAVIAAHLSRYPHARSTSADGARTRTPLLRSRRGGRLNHGGIGRQLRQMAYTAGGDLAAYADQMTPNWIPVIDLHDWTTV